MDQEECRVQIVSQEYADLLMSYSNIASLEENGYCFSTITNTLAVIHMPVAELPDNYIQIYGYDVNPKCFGLTDIESVEASGVYTLRGLPATNLRGQSVLIGIIDTGIDYTQDRKSVV